jgi:hypothetical protein
MSHEQEFHPQMYPERPQFDVDESIEILNSEPEIVLTPEEKEEVLQAEKMFTRGTDLSGEGVMGIEHGYLTKVNSVDFFADYFLTDIGKTDLQDLLGEELPQELSLHEIRKILTRIDYSNIPTSRTSKISGASKQYVVNQMVSQFEANNFDSTHGVENPMLVTVIKNPEDLVSKMGIYVDFKKYIHAIKKEYVNRTDNTAQALSVVAEIHRRRVNQLIAETYSSVSTLIHQARTSGKEVDLTAVEQLEVIIGPILMKALGDTDKSERIFERYDKFINGVGDKEEGVYGVLSPEALQLANTVPIAENNSITEFEFKGIAPEVINTTRITADIYIKWAEKALGVLGELSEEDSSTWNKDRKGPAADGKIQVVIDTTRKALAYNDVQRVLLVPASFDRGIAQIEGGGLPTLDHEIAHVIQNENKRKLGLAITDQVRMDRSSIYSEAGALAWETETQERLFGNKREISPHYLRAIQARIKGGTLRDCSKAFFDSYVSKNPTVDKLQAMDTAVDRAMRLFRNNGRYNNHSRHLTNSQPLVYLEQELVAKKLLEKGRSELLMIGGINLEMLAELHRVGLLDLSNITLPTQKPSDIVLDDVYHLLSQTQ